ncbi:MAG: hypothetical protein UX09_C0049G0001, partial [Candidatus Uhrbacteria bacterium GW2011_GWE2_45_35]
MTKILKLGIISTLSWNLNFPKHGPLASTFALRATVNKQLYKTAFANGIKPGPLAQLVERFHGMEEVNGSIPLRSTRQLLRSKYSETEATAWSTKKS